LKSTYQVANNFAKILNGQIQKAVYTSWRDTKCLIIT